MNRIDAFLELVVQQGGSDLHLVAGQPPRIRLNGNLHPVRFRELSPGDVAGLIDDIMTAELQAKLDADWAVDFAYQAECGRFRVNAYRHTGGVAAALRVVSSKTPSLESLQPRPERDVRIGGDLGLHPHQVLDHGLGGHRGPRQQVLAGQQRAIERTAGQDRSGRHPEMMRDRGVGGRQHRSGISAADSRRPLRRGASIAAGFANRKGIFHERFPALPLPKPTHDLAASGESLCEQHRQDRPSVHLESMVER